MFPTNSVEQVAEDSVITAWFQTQDTKSSRNDLTLLLVVRMRDSLETNQTAQRFRTTLGLLIDDFYSLPPNKGIAIFYVSSYLLFLLPLQYYYY